MFVFIYFYQVASRDFETEYRKILTKSHPKVIFRCGITYLYSLTFVHLFIFLLFLLCSLTLAAQNQMCFTFLTLVRFFLIFLSVALGHVPIFQSLAVTSCQSCPYFLVLRSNFSWCCPYILVLSSHFLLVMSLFSSPQLSLPLGHVPIFQSLTVTSSWSCSYFLGARKDAKPAQEMGRGRVQQGRKVQSHPLILLSSQGQIKKCLGWINLLRAFFVFDIIYQNRKIELENGGRALQKSSNRVLQNYYSFGILVKLIMAAISLEHAVELRLEQDEGFY